MKILLLTDALPPRDLSLNKRESFDAKLYRNHLPATFALASLPHPPQYGPVILATILKEKGHEVELLECATRPQNRARLLQTIPHHDVVWLSLPYTVPIEIAVAFAKKIRPHTKHLVLSGGIVTGLDATNHPAEFDFICQGDEETAGIKFQGTERGFQHTGWISDFESLPHPAWELTKRRPSEFFPLVTQKSCSFRCSFCAFPANDGYRKLEKSLPQLRQELERNAAQGIHRYFFQDATFNHPLPRAKKILELLQTIPGKKIEWIAYARVDQIDDEFLTLAKNSGCRALFFGIESGDESVLRSMKKGFTPAQALAAVKKTKGYGINVTASWIVGYPDEQPQSLSLSLACMEEMGANRNYINSFVTYQQTPADKTFGELPISGELRLTTTEFIEKALQKGIKLGSIFDSFLLSHANLQEDEMTSFLHLSQAPVLSEPENKELLALSDRIFQCGATHPIFQ